MNVLKSPPVYSGGLFSIFASIFERCPEGGGSSPPQRTSQLSTLNS